MITRRSWMFWSQKEERCWSR